MAAKDITGIINEKPVFVKQWPATKALENLSKALSTFGPRIGPFVEGNFLMGDIVSLLDTSESEVVVSLLKEFVSSARMDGIEVTPVLFDKYYTGDLLFVFKIFSFVCEVQYKDFFEQGQRLKETRPEQTQKTKN